MPVEPAVPVALVRGVVARVLLPVVAVRPACVRRAVVVVDAVGGALVEVQLPVEVVAAGRQAVWDVDPVARLPVVVGVDRHADVEAFGVVVGEGEGLRGEVLGLYGQGHAKHDGVVEGLVLVEVEVLLWDAVPVGVGEVARVDGRGAVGRDRQSADGRACPYRAAVAVEDVHLAFALSQFLAVLVEDVQ